MSLLGVLTEIIVKTFLIAGLTLIALRLLRHRSGADRASLAHIAVIACLCCPFLIVAGPQLAFSAPPMLSAATDTATAPFVSMISSPQSDQAGHGWPIG